jgi:hypothetical protein
MGLKHDSVSNCDQLVLVPKAMNALRVALEVD